MFVRSYPITKFTFAVVVSSLLALLFVVPVSAAESMTLVAETEVEEYQTLKAKVAYLTAYLSALIEGEPTDTTFVMALNGNLVQVDGTIVRAAQPDLMEICGPMAKGEIDWGDGTKETLHGLGCSGDVHTFTAYHAYGTPDSYTITVSGGAGRDGKRVVAAGNAGAEVSELLATDLEGITLRAEGSVTLDDPLPRTCSEIQIATILWGDGSSEAIMSDCSTLSFESTHEYPRSGTYKVLVIDQDGDAAQELIVIE